MVVKIHNNTFDLHKSGAIFWQEQSMLLIADVHLGKVAHFRKHGAAIPAHVAHENLERLTNTVDEFRPKNICFLGDLFHSKLNTEWEDFASWTQYTNAQIILVNGNHDVIPKYLFKDLGVQIEDELIIDSFLLTHHPTKRDAFFNFCGHIHPGVRMQGLGRQTMKFACFFKTKNQLIFPAFGNFTGKYILEPTKDDEIFVLVDGEVVSVS
ncbi:DEAD/DEAH box helicase [Patiriisocius marinistellae]|uniref:DEAD/DEAH box helicase n=1 Tax=Patiriisocius marinistellae TaxID=2494560 RepID=A0A5J4FZE6_9FLAO|nr:ligase-associated DNA damage response endonuclease PdeM [Patiriisocius marinistellae]GEQ85071.1 DEAD/DEAH box helicase [Patiriisocius marinistellae]